MAIILLGAANGDDEQGVIRCGNESGQPGRFSRTIPSVFWEWQCISPLQADVVGEGTAYGSSLSSSV